MIINLYDYSSSCENEIVFTSLMSVKRFISEHVNTDIEINTHDERVLQVIKRYRLSEFEKENSIYIYYSNVGKSIRDTTVKEIRDSHDLCKMYIANSFNFS